MRKINREVNQERKLSFQNIEKLGAIDKLRLIPKRTSPRQLLAIGLLLASLLAAITITSQANRSVLVWAAKGDLAVGDSIRETDLVKTKVLLPENSLKYLSYTAKIVGSIVVRRIGGGELIPSSALSKDLLHSEMRSVPFKIAKSDLPADLGSGQMVDLYVLPIKNINDQSMESVLVAKEVSVESVDIKTRDMGGDIGIVLKIPNSNVLDVLSAIPNTRLVVVRSAI